MKKNILICLLLTFAFYTSLAQKRVAQNIESHKTQQAIKAYSAVFTVANTPNIISAGTFISQHSAITLQANEALLKQIENEKSSFLSLEIPALNPVVLELIPIEIFSPTYKVTNANNQEVPVKAGVHYQGIIKGNLNSLASISIVDGEISGFISNESGNFVLGKLKNSEQYIYYKESELVVKRSFECGVTDEGLQQKIDQVVETQMVGNGVSCRAVQIYIEVDYAMYQLQDSSIPTTTTFVNALFAQVAVLYNNENVAIQIAQIKVWNSIDPYASTNDTADMLTAFSNNVSSNFTGDLAHLFSSRGVGGGRANLDVLCSKGKGVSGDLNKWVQNVPAYSWNVDVVAHELGHNFGSPHTHSCSWPGGAIDNCYTTEGGCAPGPSPVNGGTVMSYCHLNIGKNFSNGFGLLPGNRLRDRTQRCMGSAVAPDALIVVDTYNTSVVLSWNHGFSSSYTLEYKPVSSNTWVSTNTVQSYIQLTNLTANTSYNWRVKTSCSGFTTGTFATNNTPAIIYCIPSYYTGCNTYAIGINDVIINGVNFNPASGCTSGGYSLITNSIRNLTVGQTCTFTINPLWIGGNIVQAAIWIDFNKNGSFDTNEGVFSTTSATNSAITGSFIIPANTLPVSKTRIRVMLDYYNAPTNTCGSYIYGETEEFLINLISSSPCQQIVTLISPANNITSGNITKQASAVNGKITASNLISGSNTKVTYQAKTIELNQGFRVESGTVFRAETGGCSY